MKKNLVLCMVIAVLSGCHAKKNYVNSTTVVGVDISLNPENYIPNLRMGYITNDYAGIVPESDFELRREYAGSTASDTVTTAHPWELNKHIQISNASDSERDK